MVRKINIKYGDILIKQHSKVKYLGCILDETMSGETMALSVINKINNKLKFLYQKKQIFDSNPETIALQCTYSTTFRLSLFCLVSQLN